ncbi:hypothetical protein AOLI_G00244570 [Acnodon oligacanthus]
MSLIKAEASADLRRWSNISTSDVPSQIEDDLFCRSIYKFTPAINYAWTPPAGPLREKHSRLCEPGRLSSAQRKALRNAARTRTAFNGGRSPVRLQEDEGPSERGVNDGPARRVRPADTSEQRRPDSLTSLTFSPRRAGTAALPQR